MNPDRDAPLPTSSRDLIMRNRITGVTDMSLSRRKLMLAVAGTFATSIAAGETLKATPQETFGPYFPVHPPRELDADLTRVAGQSSRALGQVIELGGRVLRVDGTPVAGAEIEIWQANAAGRYAHPMDRNPAPLDPAFQGVAKIRSGADGSWRILTVKPGAYPDGSGGKRAPHVHFDVVADDYRLVTQMYFPGEPLNATDMLITTMEARHRDIGAATCREVPSTSTDTLRYAWDIVLPKQA